MAQNSRALYSPAASSASSIFDWKRPQDPFAALLMLKRQLAHHQTRFPLYDFACVWYLRETGQLTQLHSFFPAEEMGFITELVNLLGRLPYVALANAVFAMMGKRWGHWFTVYRHRRKLDEAQVAAILQMDVQTELLEALPRLFAHDLNTMMAVPQAPHRLVLFFDTHEAFWGVRERESSRDRFFQRDEWFRQLLGYLDLPQGIVVVVAGRDTPRWAQASRATIPNTFVDTQLVGHLSATDAATYLKRAGIVEPAMRDQLVHYTQVAPGQSHPFYLGLCTDVVLASLTRGVPLTPQDFHTAPQLEARTAELLDRFLRYVDVHVESAVRALSACRAFDWEIYLALGTALHFQATPAAFEVLCRFSFVWRAETSAEGWYRIHDLVRRIMHERPAKGIHQAHEVLEHYYRAKAATGDTAAGAEAIYAEYEHRGPGRRGRRPQSWRYHAVRYRVVADTRRLRRVRRGRPAKTEPPPMGSGYRLVVEVENLPNSEEANGWTVLATTVPTEACADAEILQAYQEQHTTVEPGFRWIKNPAAIAPVWREKPERIAA